MSKTSDDNDTTGLNEFNLKNSNCEIMLVITIDRNLTFNKHIENLCKRQVKNLRTSKNITIS